MGKKQHYTPQLYLSGFIDPGKPPFLWVYEKEKDPRPSKTKEVGFENYFYAFTNKDGERDTDTMEEAFNELEDKAGPVIQKIISYSSTISPEDLNVLAWFVAFQMTRGPKFRVEMDEITKEFIRLAESDCADSDEALWEKFRLYEERTGKKINIPISELKKHIRENNEKLFPKDMKHILGEMGAKADLAYKLFREMRFTFWRTPSARKLVTSDHPIYKRGVNLYDKHISVTFPLSKDYLLEINRRGLPFSSEYRQIEKPYQVDELNVLTIKAGTRFVFASENSSEIKRMVDQEMGNATTF